MNDFFEKLGYSEIERDKILKNHAVNRYSLNTLKCLMIKTFDFFRSYGYLDEEIVSMTVLLPSLFNYSE